MSKKTTRFDLIHSNFRQMSICTSLLHKLSSSEFWPLCTEYSTSRVKTQSYFKDQPVYRCEMQEMRRLNYFFEIFYCNLHYYKRLVPQFQEMTVNTATWWIKENDFSKVSRYFPLLSKACLLYYFRAALKRLIFNSSAIMCYVMKTENIKL